MAAPFLLCGSAHPDLGASLAAELGVSLRASRTDSFPDGELHVRLEDEPRGEHAFVLQPTFAPVERNLIELLLLVDACRRSGATGVTAVVPYLGYARQDRRTAGGQAVGLRVMADLMAAAGVHRVVSVDVHSPSAEAASSTRFDDLSALPSLVAALGDLPRERCVVVAPDLGAVPRARRVARMLDAPTAFVHKTRLSGEEVSASGLAGEVRGRIPLVVDDMISTGGTLEAAVRLLVSHGCETPVHVAATHGLFVGSAWERLARLPIGRLCVTDTVPAPARAPVPVERVPVAPALAAALGR